MRNTWGGHSVAMLGIVICLSPLCREVRAQDQGISEDERAALMAVYEHLGGIGWARKDGWGGKRGTECKWYGVGCSMLTTHAAAGSVGIVYLTLSDNGLVGKIPPEIGLLTNLNLLRLDGNKLTGRLPPALLTRWDRGELVVHPLHIVDDSSEISVEVTAPSVRCGAGRTVTFDASSLVTRVESECADEEPRRVEYRGTTTRANFLFMARWLRETREVPMDRAVSSSDVGSTAVRVSTESGVTEEESIPGGTLRDWAVRAVVGGVTSGVVWKKVGPLPK